MSQFLGTGVAVITPFKKDKSIDYVALKKILNHLIDQGIDYLVCQGSTGEKATLSIKEQTELASFFVSEVNERIPLVLGIGGNNTSQVISEIQSTDLSGYAAILSASPHYNKPSQEGLYKHFGAIAQASPIPVFLYNVPSRTSINLMPDTVVKLANNYKNIIGIKEAAGSMAQAYELIKKVPKDFLVISGDDLLALSMTLAGGAGVISVLAQGKPIEFSKMIDLGLKNDAKEAHKLFYDIMPSIDYIYQEGNPAGIKAMLSLQGFCANELRLPLTPISDSLLSKIKSTI